MELPEGLAYLVERAGNVLLKPSSIFSLSSLTCALAIAVAFVAARRIRRGRRIRGRTLMRALFPRRITSSRSHALDVGYFFFNMTVFGLILGWAVLSYQVLTNLVIGGLVTGFGPATPTQLPDFAARAIVTVVLFLAYEFGYWLNHYLSHKIPFLWEFHKVHHAAEVLTPLTNFRVHPVDSLMHANIVAMMLALANGVTNYALGETAYQYAITDRNLLFVLFIHLLLHLQHTHLWIAFRGLAGRLVLSPAHHQIHHSNNPVHFDKNLGGCLAVWDWLFGTLHVPAKTPEKLTFGVDDAPEAIRHDHHALGASLVYPVWNAVAMAGRTLRPASRPPAAQPQPAPNPAAH